jgi:hypothetical protein
MRAVFLSISKNVTALRLAMALRIPEVLGIGPLVFSTAIPAPGL